MFDVGVWTPHEQNLVTFVLVDGSGTEVVGLGNVFDVYISKGTGLMAAALGAKGEKGLGWYWYLGTVGDADTIGPVSLAVQAAGATQQNLEYVCGCRTPNSVPYTYTVTDDVTALPVAAVTVSISVDAFGLNLIWTGQTDVFGVARDVNGNLPLLVSGTYYFWRQKPGWLATDPDVETF